MNKMKKILLAVMCAWAVPYCLPAQQLSVNSLLATLDGAPITLMDVMLEGGTAERDLAAVYTGERLSKEIEKHRRAMLENIIDRKLVYKEYKREPFEITRQSVETVLDRIAATFGGREHLTDKLKSDGMTLGNLRQQIRERIAVDILLARNCDILAVVTPKEVYDAYMADEKNYTEPEKVSYQLISVSGWSNPKPEETASQVAAALRKEPWDKVAEKYSATQKEHSRVTDIKIDSLRPEFRDAVKGGKAGDIIGPVALDFGFYFFRILEHRPAMRIPFEQVSQKLYDELMKKKTEAIRQDYRKRLREKAMIRYYI